MLLILRNSRHEDDAQIPVRSKTELSHWKILVARNELHRSSNQWITEHHPFCIQMATQTQTLSHSHSHSHSLTCEMCTFTKPRQTVEDDLPVIYRISFIKCASVSFHLRSFERNSMPRLNGLNSHFSHCIAFGDICIHLFRLKTLRFYAIHRMFTDGLKLFIRLFLLEKWRQGAKRDGKRRER